MSFLFDSRQIHELGDDNPALAFRLNNLAEIYRLQSKYKDAEPLYIQTINISAKKLGDGHTSTKARKDDFRKCLCEAIQVDKTYNLSNDPLTQFILQELQGE